MNMGKVMFSLGYLEAQLQLPATWEIKSIFMDHRNPDSCWMVIKGSDFPEIQSDRLIPDCKITVTVKEPEFKVVTTGFSNMTYGELK